MLLFTRGRIFSYLQGKILVASISQMKSLLEIPKLRSIKKTYLNGNPRVREILTYNKDNLPVQGVLAEDARGLPGNREFLESGWSETMLLRYALAMHFASQKKVLDTCSGLGWGAYLLDGVCTELTCIDIDAKSIEAAGKMWSYERTKLVQGSVLEMPFSDRSFELVTAMESIEHFSRHDIARYLDEITRVLKPGGWLAGSSYFPVTEKEAEEVCSRNEFHLHICTLGELKELLRERGYEKIRIFGNRVFFVARKRAP